MTVYYSYHPALCVESYNFPSLSKAKVLHDELVQRGNAALLPPAKVSISDLYKIHAKHYVDELYKGERSNGFGNKDPDLFNSALYAVRCHTSAARYAFHNRVNTFSLTSGAHHACYDKPGGFCTFNALIYAARDIVDCDPEARVLILDGDAHYGDGCVDIIKKLGLKRIDYARGRTAHEIQGNIGDVSQYSLVLWNAGADAFHTDCGDVTADGWYWRDQFVRKLGVPVCTSLAGGYVALEDVVNLHWKTINALTQDETELDRETVECVSHFAFNLVNTLFTRFTKYKPYLLAIGRDPERIDSIHNLIQALEEYLQDFEAKSTKLAKQLAE